ncbi:MAG: thioredoxin family protein [Rhodothermales bacterium]
MKRVLTSTVSLLVAGLLLFPAQQAWSQEKEAFTEERFEELQSEGALILIDVFADWCPTCAQQQKVLDAYLDEHPDVPLHILQVNFDEQKEWVRAFRAPRQSTLILYRGEEQVWFNVAETSRDVIFAALNEAAEST